MSLHIKSYVLRFGELGLKGRNQDRFVDDLIKIVKPRVKHLDGKCEKRHKRVLLHTTAPPEQVRTALSTVFGLAGISPIYTVGHELDDIKAAAWELMKKYKDSGKTFAIRGRRPNKKYPMTSMDLQREVATFLLQQGLNLKVDLKNPDIELGLSVETRETWLYLETWPGLGGLPVCGRTTHGLLLSGGIDSPVAGNLIQKRGGRLEAVYFHTPPFTVEAAREKVEDLAEVLARYQNGLALHVVNFTNLMKTLRAKCDERYTVILSRRFMMRVAVELLKPCNGQSLVTGESLGQVASQTIENITAVNEGLPWPVLRPCIGMDKQEIIRHARRIGTFDISIQPFEDCCSLFSPKNPVTKALLDIVHKEEAKIDAAALIEEALTQTERIIVFADYTQRPLPADV
ncbi:tRNA uracil 4-sulfurtransferase ThiI [Acanthopleuribacter pedis]|uniref:Probable tRNA sulfurtransferase n=1 Tax=Acanthopleuribacter pedis TaxID=442870 RepID=A0A8J7U4Z9_9BACT|nr:tRNA uracil 4-sulfurtransferase ThiI [Acanthopleuribacter pedis]MBO1321182.1 tRNA 4-thiouridine(8) synthase ThiI [Acanthopleuribacter pedis]